MKWKKKLSICSLAAGIILLTNSCNKKNYTLNFLSEKHFTNFPSASAIEIFNNKIYLFGDDATSLLILDTSYNTIDSINFLNVPGNRIAKDIKPDIESATILTYGDKTYLYSFGSFSTALRKIFYSFPLDSPDSFVKAEFKIPGVEEIKEWNIEGAAFVKDHLVFANRGNTTNPVNHLIVTNVDLQNEINNSVKTSVIQTPESKISIGISGLYYLEEKDILFFTASEEDTPNAYEDGTIGDSYIGWIKDYSKKMFHKNTSPTEFVKLSEMDSAFVKQKIESVCVSVIDKGYILHLAADNDNGESRLFKLRLVF